MILTINSQTPRPRMSKADMQKIEDTLNWGLINKPQVERTSPTAFAGTDKARENRVISKIKDLMPKMYGKTFDEVNVYTRKRGIVEIRQAVTYFMLKYSGMGSQQIGDVWTCSTRQCKATYKRVPGYDHSVVLHSRSHYLDVYEQVPHLLAAHGKMHEILTEFTTQRA